MCQQPQRRGAFGPSTLPPLLLEEKILRQSKRRREGEYVVSGGPEGWAAVEVGFVGARGRAMKKRRGRK